MSQNEFLNLALFGKTKEEKHLGMIMTYLQNQGAKTKGDKKGYEILISPKSIEELVKLNSEVEGPHEIYFEETKRWYDENPSSKEEDIVGRARRKFKDVDSKLQNEIKIINKITREIKRNKTIIYNDLAGKFEGIMARMITTNEMAVFTENYKRVKKLIEDKPELEKLEINELFKNTSSNMRTLWYEVTKNPTSKGLMDSISKLNGNLIREYMKPLKAEAPDFEYVFDMFCGRIGGSYINSHNEFFEEYDVYAEVDNVIKENPYFGNKAFSFYLHGMLEGTYALSREASMIHPSLRTNKEEWNQILSPICLGMSISDSYESVIQEEFDKIKKQYGSKVLDLKDLVKF